MKIRKISRRDNARQFSVGLVFIATALASGVAMALTDSERQEEFNNIDEGFRLFTTETFNGNGRTCSTCHIPKENYNIFPSSIKSMTMTDQTKVFASNVPGLENVDIVKARALFNISGNASTPTADDPALFDPNTPTDHTFPTFRSSMTLAAFDITSTNASANFPGTPLLDALCSAPPVAGVGNTGQLSQLGWSGDAAPGSPVDNVLCRTHHGNEDLLANGSILSFANGAIAQHNTLSLNRIEGVDFRFATETEAKALEIFQRWLGRRALSDAENTAQGTTGRIEYDIASLDFADDRIDLGRDHYAAPSEFSRNPAAGALTSVDQNQDSGAGCNACHTNGGANTGTTDGTSAAIGGPNNNGQNVNVNTEVELGSDDIAVALFGAGSVLPHDEGASDSFGPAGTPTFEEDFNIQSIIEAPRKKAWFHNHRALDTFEKNTLPFYITADFRQTPDSDPNGDGDNGDFTDPSIIGSDFYAAAFTSDEVMRYGNAIKSLGTISFPKGDGIQHIGAFLRSLSAYYSLRDCERLVAEMKERIEVAERLNSTAKIDVPLDHARFAIADAQKVLTYIQLKPVPYSTLIPTLKSIDTNIYKVKTLLSRRNNTQAKNLLVTIGDSLIAAREKIAIVKPPVLVTTESVTTTDQASL